MKKRRNHSVITAFSFLVFIVGTFNSARSEVSFFFSHLGVENGLSQVSVLNIFQDSDGYMWFGTSNGVNRYNGYEFTIYRNEVNDSTSLSDNYIQAINEDQDKNIWIATSNGINCIDYQTNIITRFYAAKQKGSNNSVCRFLKHADGRLFLFAGSALFQCGPDKKLQSVTLAREIHSTVYSVFQDEVGDIFVGTDNDGLYMYSSSWKFQHHFLTNPTRKQENIISIGTITSLHGGSNGQIWIGSNDNGIFLLEKKQRHISCFNRENSGLLNNSIRALTLLTPDSLLIGTFGGLNVLNTKTHEITPIRIKNGKKGALSHYSIHSLLIDKDKTLWVGTFSGINYHSLYYNPIFMITPEQFIGIIGKGQEDASGILWFATEGAGLFKYDPRTGSQKLYPITTSPKGSYDSNIIKSILVRGDSIFCTTHFGSVYLFSIKKRQYKKIFDSKVNDIYSLCLDSRNRLWIPTHSSKKLVRIEGTSVVNRFPIQNGFRTFDNITMVEEIRPGFFILGSLHDSIYLYDEKRKQVTNLRNTIKLKGSQDRLGSITSILYDNNQGKLWIATSRGGIMRFDQHFKLTKHYQKDDGLSDSYISSMIRDKENRIWAATGSVLYQLNIQEDLFYPVKLYGVPKQEFTLFGGGCLSSDGNIYFAGNKGVISFFSGEHNPNPILPRVHITSVIVSKFNEKASVKEKNVYNSRLGNDQLVLSANQNNLTICFVALNYISSSQNQYSFQLEGVDPGWHMAGHRREAYYNNLSPGKYIFRVKASNNDGIWNPDETVLYITIIPPFYKTWFAYVLYSVLAMCLVLWMGRIMQKKQEQKREKRFKQMEQDKLNELHEERMRMFTNFSHELRTPLTLIMNPLQDLLERVPFSPEVKDRLSMMKKNTGKMLLLVNNLMDIQKYEAGKLSLTKTRFDFTLFIKDVFQNFESIAQRREIDFNLFCDLPEPFSVFYDKSEIEKVIFNLLSNAFKFTPSKGAVKIHLDLLEKAECISLPLIPKDQLAVLKEARYLLVEISDTGLGVQDKDVMKVFEPFFRNQHDIHHQIAGTGIGLTLTKSIVTLHGGIIWLDSSKKPGAHFILLLPDSLKSEEEKENVLPLSTEKLNVNKKVLYLVKEHELKKKQTLLLVDDNHEILQYLESQLLDEYNVEMSFNGKKALDLLEIRSVDLIISDVMMPEMNGLEFCKRIKSNKELCHIPVLLLTAKSMVAQIEEGLEAGADDYIVKPFQISLLKARIRNILSLREKIKEQAQEPFSLKSLGINLNDEDTDFLSRYIEIVKLNITNPDLDVAVIYQGLGMSRANFYRKVKAVTGLSPIELIRNIRLDTGARLLKESDLNVSEIAQQVGFSSRSYFARSFKTVYGMSPSEYQELK